MGLLVIMTSSFPYLGGEPFLETEVPYWSGTADQVVLLPASAEGVPRNVPSGIEVDLTLARSRGKRNKLRALGAALIHPELRKELRTLVSMNRFSVNNVRSCLVFLAQALLAQRALMTVVGNRGVIDLVYSYWNDCDAYGAALCKRMGLVTTLVSRAHGYDIYEEVRSGGHMPMKRQFLTDFDFVYPNSRHAAQYMSALYRMPRERLIPSRLAVPIPESATAPTGTTELHIISISFCQAVKRINTIIEAVALTATRLPIHNICWTHVGGGPLLKQLEAYAHARLDGISNVTHTFRGTVTNREVWEFLASEPIDVLVNASRSEGLGVSIMEAMSFGIPAVAPDVGGVSELVGDGRGVLTRSQAGAKEIAEALTAVASAVKTSAQRDLVRAFVASECDAAQIYPRFVRRCIALTGRNL